jgi:hypothetical protein
VTIYTAAEACALKWGYWTDHPEFPVKDWQYEVANGDTRQGYWQWVADRTAEAEL